MHAQRGEMGQREPGWFRPLAYGAARSNIKQGLLPGQICKKTTTITAKTDRNGLLFCCCEKPPHL